MKNSNKLLIAILVVLVLTLGAVLYKGDTLGGRSTTTDTDTVNVALIDSTTSGEAAIDDSTNSLQTIEYEHHEVHNGGYYSATDVTDVGANATKVYYIDTSSSTDDRYMHAIFGYTAQAEVDMKVYEVAAGTSTQGTQVSSYNHRRTSSNTSGNVIWENMYASATGTSIIIQQHRGGEFNTGYEGGHSLEFILDDDNDYYIVFVNQTAADNQIGLQLEWYEHIDANTITGG